MKTYSALLLLLTGFGLIASAQTPSQPQAQTKTKPSTAKPLVVPANAEDQHDGTWLWTDKAGKKWVYNKTPFGVVRNPAPTDAKATKTLPPGIPKGATLNPDGRYQWTDTNGNKWSYSRTPFGWSKTMVSDPANVTASSIAPADKGVEIKITDKGDTVRFERKSPMGPVVWEKKKSDLSDQERRIYEAQKESSDKAR